MHHVLTRAHRDARIHPHATRGATQELWLELKDLDELQAAQVALPEGKLLVVDYYAGARALQAVAAALQRGAQRAVICVGVVQAAASLLRTTQLHRDGSAS